MYFPKWLQRYIPFHIFLYNMTLTYLHQEVESILHTLKSGWAWLLLWPIEYGRSDTLPVPSINLNFLACSASCLLEVSHHLRRVITTKPLFCEDPTMLEKSWRTRYHVQRKKCQKCKWRSSLRSRPFTNHEMKHPV